MEGSLNLMGRLASAVAHDLSNQLMVISARARFALDAVPPGSEARGHIEEIGTAAARAAIIIRCLGKTQLAEPWRPQLVDLGGLLSQLEPVLSIILRKSHSVEVKRDAASAVAYVDPLRVERIALALALHCADSEVARGKLTITAGVGPVDSRITGRFPAVVATPHSVLAFRGLGSDDAGGTVDSILDQLQTDPQQTALLWCDSASAGARLPSNAGYVVAERSGASGMDVVLYLSPPDATESRSERTSGSAVPAAAAPAWPRSGRTILVVDDEPAIRRAMARVLHERGYAVLEAQSGADALLLAEVHSRHIDILVTDVDMPGMSGRELARELRARQPGIRTLILSGCEEALAAGAKESRSDGFLAKPFDLLKLVSMIEDFVSGTERE